MVSRRVLKVKPANGDYSARWSHLGLTFAHCSKIVNNQVKQLSYFSSCREDLSSYLFNDDRFNDERGKVSAHRSRYIVRHITGSPNSKASEKWFDKATEAGLRIVNIIEARHGWPLTKMFDVESSSIRYATQQLTTFYKVLIGSSRWKKSPHMISLYVLLFRIGANSKFSSISSYEEISKACSTCRTSRLNDNDAARVARTFKFWDMIMANFDKMFAGMSTKDNFKAKGYGGDYYNEGISKLCDFGCSNKKINDKFVALAKSAGLA